MKQRDLITGNELKGMLLFSLPLILGNLLQQLYNVVDTLVVGRFIGSEALAAVGSSYTIMVFITSINLGLCMGSGVVFALFFGGKQMDDMKTSMVNAFFFIGALSLLLNILAYVFLDPMLRVLNIQPEAYEYTKTYLLWVFSGIMFTFIYNFFSETLRAIGNSMIPLLFLGVAAITNLVLDIIFVVPLQMGVAGAAIATVISQALSAVYITVYFIIKAPNLRPEKKHYKYSKPHLKRIIGNSTLTGIQQSVMNFGLLLLQSLVNSFGVAAMAAFAAAVKIDALAYMPAQDFGNAFSTYTAQNYGAGKKDRIKKGLNVATLMSFIFCIVISAFVFIFAKQLMMIFVKPEETEIIKIGMNYLRIEGAAYFLIGWLFLLYGFYRGLENPLMSIILTITSLGTKVALAYTLSPIFGTTGIWVAIPLGWLLADIVGYGYYFINKKRIMSNIDLYNRN